jgi:hypothetical protein
VTFLLGRRRFFDRTDLIEAAQSLLLGSLPELSYVAAFFTINAARRSHGGRARTDAT